jgi:ankyrin repeat protein
VETLQFLISKGADVNYFDENCPPHTALAAAASNGRVDSINILLEHGADILLGTEQGAISELLRLWWEKMGSTNWYPYNMKGSIKWLENIEREEREKRNIPNPPVTVTDTGLPLLNLPHTLRHY